MNEPLPSRKEFLLALAGGALLPQAATAQPGRGKLLIVTAHPDDEYAFAAATHPLRRSAHIRASPDCHRGLRGMGYEEESLSPL
jgi:hypothetical protein